MWKLFLPILMLFTSGEASAFSTPEQRRAEWNTLVPKLQPQCDFFDFQLLCPAMISEMAYRAGDPEELIIWLREHPADQRGQQERFRKLAGFYTQRLIALVENDEAMLSLFYALSADEVRLAELRGEARVTLIAAGAKTEVRDLLIKIRWARQHAEVHLNQFYNDQFAVYLTHSADSTEADHRRDLARLVRLTNALQEQRQVRDVVGNLIHNWTNLDPYWWASTGNPE